MRKARFSGYHSFSFHFSHSISGSTIQRGSFFVLLVMFVACKSGSSRSNFTGSHPVTHQGSIGDMKSALSQVEPEESDRNLEAYLDESVSTSIYRLFDIAQKVFGDDQIEIEGITLSGITTDVSTALEDLEALNPAFLERSNRELIEDFGIDIDQAMDVQQAELAVSLEQYASQGMPSLRDAAANAEVLQLLTQVKSKTPAQVESEKCGALMSNIRTKGTVGMALTVAAAGLGCSAASIASAGTLAPVCLTVIGGGLTVGTSAAVSGAQYLGSCRDVHAE